jgi:myo-inositol-hexaphosphate 3-phosphohydrolase
VTRVQVPTGRASLAGTTDKGDTDGVVSPFARVVLELKNDNRQDLAVWVNGAEAERGNADALVGTVADRSHGTNWLGDHRVAVTVDGLVKLLDGAIGTNDARQ